MASMSGSSTPASTASRRGLLSLWMARDVYALGNWVVLVALLTWTYRTRESAAVVSMLMLGQLLPPFLLGPVAGYWVNVRNARAVGIGAQVLRAAALVPLLRVADNNDLKLVLVVFALASVPSAFVRASHLVLLRGAIDSSNTAFLKRDLFATGILTMVLGPYAGTIVFSIDGLHGCTVIVLIATLLSALLLALSHSSSVAVPPALPRRSLARTLADLSTGLAIALQRPSARPVVIIRLVVALVAGGLVVAEVAFMVWGLFTGVENVGIVLASEGMGMGVGAIIYIFVRRRFPASILIATALVIVAFGEFGFAISAALKAAACLGGVVGLGKGMLSLSLVPFVADLSADDSSAPSTSDGLDFAAEAAALVSIVAIGPLTDSITPRFTIVLASIVTMVLALYAFGSVPDREAPAEVARTAGNEIFSSLPTA